MSGKEKIYGLLGRKLGHSWSVPIHRAFGCTEYRLVELEPEDLPAFLRRDDIGGLNVTIPYKQAVMPYCDGIDPDAAAIGSVNTLVRRPDGSLYAWNTDAAGFRFMADRAGIAFGNRKAVILGSGGASLTAQAMARRLGAREIVVISRNGENNYGNLDRHADAEILVNATPVGMYPGNGAATVDLIHFPALRGVLELIYNPRRTALLLQAAALGIPCTDGLPMLVSQAAEAEERFFDTVIENEDRERVLADLRRETGNIVLIGMPGSGKSVIGQTLSVLTGREAVDLDRLVEEQTGRTIPEIFASEGETAFRALERAAAVETGKRTGIILVTGGGIVNDERNYASLKQNGRIYHILRDLSRLSTQGRPLSQGADLAVMWEERRPCYERFRDAVIDNNGTIQAAADAVWRDFCAYSGTERP